MSLLKITTTPIEYEIKVERAKLQQKQRDYQEIKQAQAELARKQQLKSDPNIVKKAEEGSRNTADYQSLARSRANSVAKATTASRIPNNQLGSMNNTSVNIVLSADKANKIDFISEMDSESIDSSFFVNSAKKMSGMISGVPNEWTVSKKEMEYVPGRFQMDIIQYPKVTIEYIGGTKSAE